jgi:hypothetical protein
MRVEVTDLFTGFYELAEGIWPRFEFEQPAGVNVPRTPGPTFEEITDILEEYLVLAACARRYRAITGLHVMPNQVREMLVLTDGRGELLPGKEARFHSNGFTWGDEMPSPLVVPAGLVPRPLSEVRLFLAAKEAGTGLTPWFWTNVTDANVVPE